MVNNNVYPFTFTAATIESLFDDLANHNVLQLWDELATWTSTFGLYKAGGGAYDRSKFLSLYNNSQVIKHQTKSGKLQMDNFIYLFIF